MNRAVWVLLLPCMSSWAACDGVSSSSVAAAAAAAASGVGGAPGGVVNAVGGVGATSAAEPVSGQSVGGAGASDATGGAGGAPPAACATDAAAPNVWASWPLSNPTTQGEPDSQSFTLTDDVATDDVTQLEWQRQSPDDTFTWTEAKQYCDCLALAGHDDWQLPSRIELVSIVDYTKQNPSINADVFPNTPFEWFWTASPMAGDDRYWYVGFFDGDTHASSIDSDYRVRCVRRAPGQQPRYDTSLEGIVKDASTGLSWQRTASADQESWDTAKATCDSLTLAGEGWRLPSMSELQSLIDESQADPAIDGVAFPDTPSEGFWAGTPLAGMPTAAWFVSFTEGIAYNAVQTHPYRVRCVR